MGRRLTWIVALGALLVLLPLAYAYITPNDPQYPGTTTTGQWNLRMIGVDKTWKHTRGAGVKVAIVGQGVPLDVDADAGKPSHEDRPINYRSNLDGDTVAAGDNAPHDASGTSALMQLSIMAANTNNGVGVASIAPEADVFVIRNLGSGTDFAEGIDLARAISRDGGAGDGSWLHASITHSRGHRRLRCSVRRRGGRRVGRQRKLYDVDRSARELLVDHRD
ncbi:MAG: hypothetical protein IT381_03905 [Deltaproteobacteria bacterium]|nr:hypothetical protein [Deltaproteobacteria bacterium]